MGLSHRVFLRLYASTYKKDRPLYDAFLYNNGSYHVAKDHKKSNRTVAVGSILILFIVSICLHARLEYERGKALLNVANLVLLMLATLRMLLGVQFTSLAGLRFSMSLNISQLQEVLAFIGVYICKMYENVERIFYKSKNLSPMMNQLVFFTMSDYLFGRKTATGSLYTLMFFNVITYCVSYIKQLIERENWSLSIHVGVNTNVRHLAMTATNVALEWTKAITFIITVIFILLVMGLEKGLENYAPSNSYLAFTGVYFILTEDTFVRIIHDCFNKLRGHFEVPEMINIRMAIKLITLASSAILTVISFMFGYISISLIASFTNLRMTYMELDHSLCEPLRRKLVELRWFRYANKCEIASYDDVCAICLCAMSTARITQCNHMFHSDCLLLSLSTCRLCPICKRDL